MQDLEAINRDLDALSVAKFIGCDVEEANQYIPTTKITLNIICQNIRSINCNFSNFITLVQRSNIAWDIIVLSECWLQSAKYIPAIHGYSYISTTRNNTQNEGIVIYFNKQLKIEFDEPPIENANSLLVKVNNEYCILCIYRPPSSRDTTNFTASLDTVLSSLSNFRSIILCGDINLDINPTGIDHRANDYLNMLAGHAMLPGYTEPTHGRTCLDHIIIKSKCEVTCFLFNSSVTDHVCTALSITLKTYLLTNNRLSHKTDFNQLDSFLATMNFQPVIESTDPNRAANSLISLLTTAIKSSTKVSRTPRRKFVSKPWITTGLLRCMRQRDRLFKKTKMDPNNDNLRITYKRYRNYCNSILKKVKRKYERDAIDKSKNNKKQLWNVIKDICGSKHLADHSVSLVSSSDPLQNLNNVNNYFASVGSNLTNQIASCSLAGCNCNRPLTPSPCGSFVMTLTDESEVLGVIRDLREKCAVGVDLISGTVIKRYAQLLATPITHICNLAINSGVFPQVFKLGQIKPIYKSGDKNLVDNYRPISVLPTLSKILERIMNKRLVNYLETNNLLSSSQYGFRRGKSTNDAVHDLTSSIVTALDKKKKCLVLFLDLAKAFDTVSIPRLLKKLEWLGIRGLPLKLFTDYLTKRTQKVKIDQWTSEEVEVTHGVPQGSIVGPTLFLAYINDLCQLEFEGGRIFTFADDTALFFQGDTWTSTFELAQAGFNRVNKWLNCNFLSLNVLKTKYISFALKTNGIAPESHKITAHRCDLPSVTTTPCSCPVLERTASIKYLGVLMDQTLTFKPHLTLTAARLRKLIYIFRTLRHIADRKVIKTVYYALAHSLLEYCITIWGGAAKSHLIELERAQRALLKVGACLPFRYPTATLYRDWELLTVRQTFILRTVLKMHTQLPYIPKLLNDKRRKKVCVVPLVNTAKAQNFYNYLGPYIYNKINEIQILYPLTKAKCKMVLSKFLNSLNYEETEKLIHSLT